MKLLTVSEKQFNVRKKVGPPDSRSGGTELELLIFNYKLKH